MVQYLKLNSVSVLGDQTFSRSQINFGGKQSVHYIHLCHHDNCVPELSWTSLSWLKDLSDINWPRPNFSTWLLSAFSAVVVLWCVVRFNACYSHFRNPFWWVPASSQHLLVPNISCSPSRCVLKQTRHSPFSMNLCIPSSWVISLSSYKADHIHDWNLSIGKISIHHCLSEPLCSCSDSSCWNCTDVLSWLLWPKLGLFLPLRAMS